MNDTAPPRSPALRDAHAFAGVDTLFLDAGNTLISLDLPWISALLAEQGIACPPAALERAEAAARPIVSARLATHGSTEGVDAFRIYLEAIAAELAERGRLDREHAAALPERLAPLLRPAHAHRRLWSRVLPGVPEALAHAGELGLKRVVVSNSNGTIETLLEELGLRAHLDAVIDSGRIGIEKPDPRIFEHALALSGAERARTLHVGDLYAVDVVGARRAGLRAVLLDPFGDWRARGVDAPTCPSVPALVERLAAPPSAHG